MSRCVAKARGCRAAASLACAVTPALAQDQIKIGIGYGLAFLPIYICEDQKLIEKHAKEAHLDVKVEFARFTSAAELQSALTSGEIAIAPFGTAPLLAAWNKNKGKPEQVFAISGMTSLPLTLLSNQADVSSLGDIKPNDQIAIPTRPRRSSISWNCSRRSLSSAMTS